MKCKRLNVSTVLGACKAQLWFDVLRGSINIYFPEAFPDCNFKCCLHPAPDHSPFYNSSVHEWHVIVIASPGNERDFATPDITTGVRVSQLWGLDYFSIEVNIRNKHTSHHPHFLCMQLVQTNHLVEASSLYCTLNSNIFQLKTNTVDIGKINMRTRIYTPI